MIAINETSDGLTFSVYVQPRASKKEIVGAHDRALKIKLTAPPVDGAANQQCIQILAKALDLPKSALTITGGRTSRSKQISIRPISGRLTPEEIQSLKSRLQSLAQPR